MKTIYLDQNMWIELTRAALNPQAYFREYELLLALTEAEATDRIQVPLTFSNIYEVQKIGDPIRRSRLALVMSNLSWGKVFRSRRQRLSAELQIFFADYAGGQRQDLAPNWFTSEVFLDSVDDLGALGDTHVVPPVIEELIRQAPNAALSDYMTSLQDPHRLAGVHKLSAGLLDLAARMERRRLNWAYDSLAMRRRAYGALLMIDHSDLILSTARSCGLGWESVTYGGASLSRKMMTDVPTFDVERELALRLESQPRPIDENDIRDMANFVAAVPYSDIVVGEAQFVNLSIQAGLHKKYETTLLRNLLDLKDFV